MITNKTRINVILTWLILVSLLLSACDQATPQPTPIVGEPAATLSPTAPSPPTMPPPPLPAPRLAYRSPAPGEEQPLDAPIVLTFDQPMDQPSVEAAFAISPTVAGGFTWENKRTVRFAATGGLERGKRYRVTIAATARNVEGTPLEEPVAFDFSTVGHLEVSQVMPAPGSDELDPDMTVTVVFNRPVVPLTAISQQAGLPDPLTFIPPVKGKGEWLNTAIYLFRPDEGFLPATHYKARVAAGLTDTSGGALTEDYVWEFTTVAPAILSVRPDNAFHYVGPTDVISVTFNQPMDHASVQASFTLKAGDRPVEGTFRWSGGEKPTAPETMIFVPSAPLPRDTTFAAKVAAGAKARVGNMSLSRDESWRFSTVKNPGIVQISPQDGAKDVDPYGSLTITFASPMQRQGFMDHLTIRPEVTPVYTYWSEYGTEVQIYFKRNPASSYTIALDADTPDKYGATLGKATLARFTIGDLPPTAFLTTGGRLGTFSAYTETVVYATYRNVTRLELSLYRLSPPTFIQLNSQWDAWDRYVPVESDLVRQWSQKVSAPRNQARLARFNLVDDKGKPLPPGLYYLQLTAPEAKAKVRDYQPSRYMFVKSRLNLTLKQTRTDALVWATDLASGQPVAGLPITLYYKTTQLGNTGATNSDGLFLAQGLKINDLWETFVAVSGQPGNDDFGIAYNGWDDGISPWNFGVDSEFWGSKYQGYIYTDRPIYRPGQTVYFKGIVRTDDDARYSLPTDLKSIQVRIQDPQGKELYKEKLSFNDMGTFHNQLVLGEEAPLGTYYIDVQDPAQDFYIGTSFLVAEYRKPEYQVTVTADREAYLGGETINVSAEATYYFGGPVADAAVHWSALSSDYWFSYRCPQGQSCPWYSWSDYEYDWDDYKYERFYSSYGRPVAEGDTKTDDQGRVTFKVPADISQEKQSQIFTLEASVTDINGQQVSNRTAVVVHKGQFYVGVAPRGYLAQVGQEKQVDLITVDWDSQPAPGVELTVVFMEHRWYSVKRQAEDGGFYWDWTAQDIPVYTTTVTTASDGMATAAFTPKKGGSYKVRAIGHDSRKNEIRSAAYFWVWGGDEYVSWRQESNNRIQLIADKQEYQVGDTAEILIPSPYTGTVQALVTVERGHVMHTQVRELESNSEVLRLPITEEHVPNIFVSVVVV